MEGHELLEDSMVVDWRPERVCRLVGERVPRVARTPILPGRSCTKCGMEQLQRSHRSDFLDYFLTLFHYVPCTCRRCSKRQRHVLDVQSMAMRVVVLSLSVALLVSWSQSLRPAQQRAPANSAARPGLVLATTGNSGVRQVSAVGLRNQDVVDLLHAGATTRLVAKVLQDSEAAFDLTPAAILHLRTAGVSDDVIIMMMERMSRNP